MVVFQASYLRIVFITSVLANTALGSPAKIISPRSLAYSRSATLAAFTRWDSAINTETPMALICLTTAQEEGQQGCPWHGQSAQQMNDALASTLWYRYNDTK